MVKRGRLEIYFNILDEIDRGAHKPTILMYKSFLSWTTLKEVLATLLKVGLIEEKKGKRVEYYLTEKGKSTLAHYIKSTEAIYAELLPVGKNAKTSRGK